MYTQGQKLTIIDDSKFNHRFEIGSIVTVVSDESNTEESRILVRGKLSFLREEIELWVAPEDVHTFIPQSDKDSYVTFVL